MERLRAPVVSLLLAMAFSFGSWPGTVVDASDIMLYDTTFCWISIISGGQTLSRTPKACPPGVGMKWTDAPDSGVISGADVHVRYKVFVDQQYTVTSVPSIVHTNVHICAEGTPDCAISQIVDDGVNATVGYAETLVNVKSQHAPPQTGNLTYGDHGTAEFATTFSLNSGKYLVLAHARFFTDEDPEESMNRTQWDVEIGRMVESAQGSSFLSQPSEIFVITISSILFLYFGWLMFHVCGEYYRGLLGLLTFALAMIEILGAMFFSTTVFYWNLHMTDITCIITPCIASVGFSMLIAPLVIKSLHFGIASRRQLPCRHFSRPKETESELRNKIALFVFGSFLVFDAIILSIWLTQETPQAVKQNQGGYYRDVCVQTQASCALSYLSLSVKGLCLGISLVLLCFARAKGIEQLALQKLRNDVTKIVIVGMIAIVIHESFSGDRNLIFVVRSLGILYSSVTATGWIYYDWEKRQVLLSYRPDTECGDSKDVDSEGSPEMGGTPLKDSASLKAFYSLFKSPIIRGYLYNQMLHTMDSESVEFCNDVIEYKKRPTLRGAKSIVKTYILPHAPKAVNISADSRNGVMRRLERLVRHAPGSDVFGRSSFRRLLSRPSSEGSLNYYHPDEAKHWGCPKEESKNEEWVTDNNFAGNGKKSNWMSMGGHTELDQLFTIPFNDVRRLIFNNNWRAFGESDYGMAAGSLIEWISFLDGFSKEEQSWVRAHIADTLEGDTDRDLTSTKKSTRRESKSSDLSVITGRHSRRPSMHNLESFRDPRPRPLLRRQSSLSIGVNMTLASNSERVTPPSRKEVPAGSVEAENRLSNARMGGGKALNPVIEAQSAN